MKKTVDLLKTQLLGMKDNVNDAMISTVKVEYNSQLTPLHHLSLVDQKDRRVSITPYVSYMVGAIEEELQKQGFNAYKFSKTTVVVNIPLPSEENRRKVVSHIKRIGEEAKVSIRNIRKKFRKRNKDHDKQLQKMVDDAIRNIDMLTE